MFVLAFDTSGFAGSVALLEEARLLGERVLDAERGSAQTLAPAIVELLQSQQVQPGQIGLVATTAGPGSFTGLRVGVTTAKAFAYAVGAAVVGLSTLEVIALQAADEAMVEGGGPTASGAMSSGAAAREIQAVMDAQRRELFVGRFRQQPPVAGGDGLPCLDRLEPDRIIAVDVWLESITAGIVVSGPGLARLVDRFPAAARVMPSGLWQPQAATVGRLGWRQFQQGRQDDLWKLSPVYLRASYAEEKAGQRASGDS